MKKFVIVLLCTILSTIGYTSTVVDNKNIFDEDEYEIAIAKSKLENKLVFIDFHAKWCTPCKWMEKNTLRNPQVRKVLDEKYITVKIDIDDFDGFDLKEQYQVRTLPTIIFLNDSGEIIHRLNETIGTTKFLSLIKNQSAHVIPKVHPSNTSPFKDSETSYANTSNQPIIQPTTTTPPHNKAPTNSRTKSSNKIISPNKSKSRGVKKIFSRKKLVQKHLTLQVGVFDNIQNARKSLQRIKGLSNQPIEILRDALPDKTVFRVLLGSFNSKDAANRYKYKMLKKHGLESFVL